VSARSELLGAGPAVGLAFDAKVPRVTDVDEQVIAMELLDEFRRIRGFEVKSAEVHIHNMVYK
jgi:hypothetical protein